MTGPELAPEPDTVDDPSAEPGFADGDAVEEGATLALALSITPYPRLRSMRAGAGAPVRVSSSLTRVRVNTGGAGRSRPCTHSVSSWRASATSSRKRAAVTGSTAAGSLPRDRFTVPTTLRRAMPLPRKPHARRVCDARLNLSATGALLCKDGLLSRLNDTVCA